MGTGFLRTGKIERRAEYDARRDAGDASAVPTGYRPPDGARTFADLSVGEVRRLIGRDVIVRADPNFGRRAKVIGVVVDAACGFLVSVAVYKSVKDGGRWVLPMNPRPESRPLLEPGKVEVVT